MTPKFIKLTEHQSESVIFVNFAQVKYIREVRGRVLVYQSDMIHDVQESLPEILALIEKP